MDAAFASQPCVRLGVSNANVWSHGRNDAHNRAGPAETQIEIDRGAELYSLVHWTPWPVMTQKKAPLRLFWWGRLLSPCCHEHLCCDQKIAGCPYFTGAGDRNRTCDLRVTSANAFDCMFCKMKGRTCSNLADEKSLPSPKIYSVQA